MSMKEDYWNNASEDYADEIMIIQPEFYKNTSIVINRALNDNDKVLDIGNGGVINYDFERLSLLQCADIAVSNTAIKRYKEFQNVEFIKANIMDMRDISENTYDAVIVQAVLHHLAGKHLKETHRNVDKAIAECMRVLKPKGKLLIVESTVKSSFEIVEKLFYFPMQLIFVACRFDHVYQYSQRSLAERINRLGLDISCIQDICLDKYTWIMGKKVLTSITPCGAVYIEIEKK